MVFLLIIGVMIYLFAPLILSLNWIEKNNYKMFNIEIDILLFGCFIVFVEIALLLQIMQWIGVINIL